MTQASILAASGSPGTTTGFKNALINGGMGIWQRGTSGFTSSGNYSADRWIVTGNTSLSTVAQSSDVPSGFKYSLSINGTGYPLCKQRIESVNCTNLASQSVTVSFWVKQTSGAGSNSIFIQLFYANSTDSFGSTTQIGSNAYATATTSWARYTATFDSISANAVNGLELVIGGNTGGAATFLITGVQLEVGTTATNFDFRSYGTELALCQRYYYAQLPLNSNTYGGTVSIVSASSNSAGVGNIIMPVTMRTAPSVAYNNIYVDYGGPTGGNTATISILYSNTQTVTLNITYAALGSTALGWAVNAFGKGTGNYLSLSAEL